MTGTLRWFKSSHSSDSGGECLEVAYHWRKSTYSNDSGGNCVEISACPHTIHIRDSKSPTGPTLTVAGPAWTNFLRWTG
ncbi:DUF397 domain-containing protein [Streptomyces odontomachi]|uniref:DUF397 domain-containing protein n=1 Tax=Streptomyces odontomachi TaxID=2944940 RepID=UPI00210A3243|nr:DUF397 domain-containing protein [Streptomyces sp. ODS25]